MAGVPRGPRPRRRRIGSTAGRPRVPPFPDSPLPGTAGPQTLRRDTAPACPRRRLEGPAKEDSAPPAQAVALPPRRKGFPAGRVDCHSREPARRPGSGGPPGPARLLPLDELESRLSVFLPYWLESPDGAAADEPVHPRGGPAPGRPDESAAEQPAQLSPRRPPDGDGGPAGGALLALRRRHHAVVRPGQPRPHPLLYPLREASDGSGGLPDARPEEEAHPPPPPAAAGDRPGGQRGGPPAAADAPLAAGGRAPPALGPAGDAHAGAARRLAGIPGDGRAPVPARAGPGGARRRLGAGRDAARRPCHSGEPTGRREDRKSVV